MGRYENLRVILTNETNGVGFDFIQDDINVDDIDIN